MIETIYSLGYPMYMLTTNNKCQHWDSILTAVSVLNTHVVHDLNGLDAYM